MTDEVRPRRRRRTWIVLVLLLLLPTVSHLLLRGQEEAAVPAAKETAVAPKAAAWPASRRPRHEEASEPQTPADAPVVTPETVAPTVEPFTPPKAEAPPVAGRTGVSVEVVDEDGRAVADATVAFSPALSAFMRETDFQRLRALLPRLHDVEAADGRAELALPDDADGLDLEAAASSPAHPPTAPAVFRVRAGHVATVRLVAVRARSTEVEVVDDDSGAPIAGASVLSLSETGRRPGKREELRGRPGPGSAVTDAAGRCVLGGLGAGAHEIEVDAPGHLRREAQWTQGRLVVRLAPVRDVGTVVVTVLGPDHRPAQGRTVRMSSTDRQVLTDRAGRAVFESVPVGSWLFSVQNVDPTAQGMTWMGQVDVAPGDRAELTLGARPGTATLHGRLLRDEGASKWTAKLVLFGMTQFEGALDAAGEVRFADLSTGRYSPLLKFPDHSHWSFDDVEVADGAHVEATWRIGGETLGGRVVRGDARDGAAGVPLSVDGPMSGLAMTGPDGRFALPGALPGTYRVTSLLGQSAGIRPTPIVVPSREGAVLVLLECGHVKARFSEADRPRVGQARVGLWTAEGDLGGVGSDPGGSGDAEIVFDAIVPGAWEVHVRLGEAVAKFPVTVVSGQTAVVDVKLP